MDWEMSTEELVVRYDAGERDFRGIKLIETRGFIDLQGWNLRDINLRGAYLREVDLTGADLTGANLFGVSLENSCLKNAIIKLLRI